MVSHPGAFGGTIRCCSRASTPPADVSSCCRAFCHQSCIGGRAPRGPRCDRRNSSSDTGRALLRPGGRRRNPGPALCRPLFRAAGCASRGQTFHPRRASRTAITKAPRAGLRAPTQVAQPLCRRARSIRQQDLRLGLRAGHTVLSTRTCGGRFRAGGEREHARHRKQLAGRRGRDESARRKASHVP